MKAHDTDRLLALTLGRALGALVLPSEANILRRAERTLHRWAELECGDGNAYASRAIERDEDTGTPYMVRYQHSSVNHSATRTRIPDREAGALRRVAALCAVKGWYHWHQTDPRGCALYISREPLTDATYTRGVAVAV
jgi:hypothetical protein